VTPQDVPITYTSPSATTRTLHVLAGDRTACGRKVYRDDSRYTAAEAAVRTICKRCAAAARS
jgi:hypothetical protein